MSNRSAYLELELAEKAVKEFVKAHKKTRTLLSEAERAELGNLLNKRAAAISRVLGVAVHSISE